MYLQGLLRTQEHLSQSKASILAFSWLARLQIPKHPVLMKSMLMRKMENALALVQLNKLNMSRTPCDYSSTTPALASEKDDRFGGSLQPGLGIFFFFFFTFHIVVCHGGQSMHLRRLRAPFLAIPVLINL